MDFKRHTSATLLFAEAEKRGLRPEWIGLDGLFFFLRQGKKQYVYYTKLHCNSQLGESICMDKSLTRRFLESENLPTIPFCYTKKPADVNRFFDSHHPIIQKPVSGMKSEGVRLILDRKQLDLTNLPEWIFEKYIEGTEYRALVLQSDVIGMQRKKLDPNQKHPWRKHITVLEKGEWNDELVELSMKIASRLHMGFLAVDVLVDAAGKTYVLELNSMPGLHSFQKPDAGKPLDVASILMDSIGS